MQIAIMQPYFFPYAGYYRLLEAADLFVILDNVQFPRTGWVHRNCIREGESTHWITLPLKKCPRETNIAELEFRDDSDEWFEKLRSYLNSLNPVYFDDNFNWSLLNPSSYNDVTGYLEQTMIWTANQLKIDFQIVRASNIAKEEPKLAKLDWRALNGQDKLIHICKALDAKAYINASGGIDLYDKTVFESEGITLKILTDIQGHHNTLFDTMLIRLAYEESEAIAKEIRDSISYKN